MSDQQLNVTNAAVASVGLGGRVFVFFALSGIAILATVLIPFPMIKPAILGAASGLLAVSVLTLGQGVVVRAQAGLHAARLQKTLHRAKKPTFLTDTSGTFKDRNAAARGFPSLVPGENLARVLDAYLADPDATIARLSAKAVHDGAAEESLETGLYIQVRSNRGRWLIWNVTRQAAAGASSLDLPGLTVSDTGQVVFANDALRQILGARPATLGDVVLDLPVQSGKNHRLRTGDGEIDATVIETGRQGVMRTLVLVPRSTAQMEETAPVLAQPDLLDALPVPMLKVAANGTLIEVNTQARAVLNLDTDSLPPLFELVEGMGRPISDWLADAAEGRGLLKPEIVRAVIPGQELFLQITLGRTIEKGNVVLVGILNDATELKTLEAQFVQSQKMQAIGQLAGGVAHDFNNLLTAISGHCDLLLLRHDSGDPDYADLIQISQNANRAASLVGQLLAFSRKQNLKPQALDLRDTMSDLAHLLNRLIGERIQLDVRHEPGPKAIRADRRQLEQVIVNLVVNARDAMPDGGTISVETRNERLEEELVRDRAHLTPGKYVVIEVRDTGIGISPEGLTKIFEPFYTTKKTGEGTGLGLSTAYGIVKQTGGFIFVDSTPGTGTVFSLYFPANSHTTQEPVATAGKPAQPPVANGDGTVLLVEDEAPVRAFACRALRLHGYTVVEAENAERALDILEDDALHIDVFVTDVIMPGMDGPTWVRQALKQRPDTNVVFMSGYAEEGRAEKQARIPNSVFLPKPFSLQQLTSLVHEQLQ